MRRGMLAYVIATLVVSVGALVGVLLAGWAPLLGLDLRGGISVVYKPAHKVPQATINETIDIIRSRVDALGVAQPNISSQGGNIVVQLPGVKDRAKALSIIGQTAELYFRPVLCQVPLGPQAAKGQNAPALSGPPPACNSTSFAKVPSSPRSLDKPNLSVLLPARDPTTGKLTSRYEMGPAPLTGKGIKTAAAQLDSQNGQWSVQLSLNSQGATKFDTLARTQFHQQVAVVLDGVVESAPQIQPSNTTFQPFNGVASITGSFTQAQASNLALVLRYGALPVQLNRLTDRSVSPTLGEASLRAGIIAGLGGLALVMLYTIAYYRALGLVVVLGLGSTACLLYAIVSTLSQTNGLSLDLSGVTGLIVSIGVTVDSYIVYFERLKDEVRAGNSIRVSVDRSFARAFRTIVAADLVSLIGAAVLYFLSVAQVQLFAFYLGLSTLLDVITAWVFTRPLVILLGRSRIFTETRGLGVARGLAVESRQAT
ncbi:MAG: protein translocase subunit SecD [Acidimicrobiales bacterium]